MTATTSTPPPPLPAPQPRFGDRALNVEVAAACFASVRLSRPLREAEAVTVHLFRENIDLWLAAPSTVRGHHE